MNILLGLIFLACGAVAAFWGCAVRSRFRFLSRLVAGFLIGCRVGAFIPSFALRNELNSAITASLIAGIVTGIIVGIVGAIIGSRREKAGLVLEMFGDGFALWAWILFNNVFMPLRPDLNLGSAIMIIFAPGIVLGVILGLVGYFSPQTFRRWTIIFTSLLGGILGFAGLTAICKNPVIAAIALVIIAIAGICVQLKITSRPPQDAAAGASAPQAIRRPDPANSPAGARFCSQCGAPLNPGAKFCPKCGNAANS